LLPRNPDLSCAGTNSKWRKTLDPALMERIRAAEGAALERFEHPGISAQA